MGATAEGLSMIVAGFFLKVYSVSIISIGKEIEGQSLGTKV